MCLVFRNVAMTCAKSGGDKLPFGLINVLSLLRECLREFWLWRKQVWVLGETRRTVIRCSHDLFTGWLVGGDNESGRKGRKEWIKWCSVDSDQEEAYGRE